MDLTTPNHEECFKPGDIITGSCTAGKNLYVKEQINQWVVCRDIYGSGRQYEIDVVNNDVHKVHYGEF